MKYVSCRLVFCLFLFVSFHKGISQPNRTINTTIVSFPPVNPLINVAFASPESFYVTSALNSITQPPVNVKIFGHIESFPGRNISIGYDANYSFVHSVRIFPSPQQLMPAQLLSAFDNFNPLSLQVSGISSSVLFKGKDVRLPDGKYKFYLVAKDSIFFPNGDTSNVVYFNICTKVKAPQFTHLFGKKKNKDAVPFLKQISPIVFNWTVPTSSCGGRVALMKYDFQIYRMYEGQTLNDALNNPFVFRREDLMTTSFILDTALYQGILMPGDKYVMTVRAKPIEDIGIEIDNDGYSRPEAFIYGQPAPPAEEPKK